MKDNRVDILVKVMVLLFAVDILVQLSTAAAIAYGIYRALLWMGAI